MSTEENRQLIGRFGSYGLFGGALLGSIIGVLFAGPGLHESDTPLNDLAVMVLACGSLGAIIGLIALYLAMPAPAEGAALAEENGTGEAEAQQADEAASFDGGKQLDALSAGDAATD